MVLLLIPAGLFELEKIMKSFLVLLSCLFFRALASGDCSLQLSPDRIASQCVNASVCARRARSSSLLPTSAHQNRAKPCDCGCDSQPSSNERNHTA